MFLEIALCTITFLFVVYGIGVSIWSVFFYRPMKVKREQMKRRVKPKKSRTLMSYCPDCETREEVLKRQGENTQLITIFCTKHSFRR